MKTLAISTDNLVDIFINTYPYKIVNIIDKSVFNKIALEDLFHNIIENSASAKAPAKDLLGIIVPHKNVNPNITPNIISIGYDDDMSYLFLSELMDNVLSRYDIISIQTARTQNKVSGYKNPIEKILTDDKIPKYSINGRNLGQIELFDKFHKNDYLDYLRDTSYRQDTSTFERLWELFFQKWFDNNSRFSKEICKLKAIHNGTKYPIYVFRRSDSMQDDNLPIQQNSNIILTGDTLITPIYRNYLAANKI